MPESLAFSLIDAFATGPYTGNPAGVVLRADGLSDRLAQLIAREINASETAFITRADDKNLPPRLRWFTPSCEVGFCGHATLAAAHAMLEAGLVTSGSVDTAASVEFQSAAGLLALESTPMTDGSGPLWWLKMPAPQSKPAPVNMPRSVELLGLTLDDLDPRVPPTRTRDRDLIVLIRGWQRLQEIRPNFAALAEWSHRNDIRGWCVATTDTLDGATTVQSRFFAPSCGIDEDPVTGSVHGPLAALLVHHGLVPFTDDRAGLNCLQGTPAGRTGMVRALVTRGADDQLDVSIAGRCWVTIEGTLILPE